MNMGRLHFLQEIWILAWGVILVVMDSTRVALRRYWLPVVLTGIEAVLLITWQMELWGPYEFSPLQTALLYGWWLSSILVIWVKHNRPSWLQHTRWQRAWGWMKCQLRPHWRRINILARLGWRRARPIRAAVRPHRRTIELALATTLAGALAVRLGAAWALLGLAALWTIAGIRQLRAAQGLQQNIAAWLRANRTPMNRIFRAWAFGLLSYTLLSRYEPLLEGLLCDERVFWLVLTWPMLIWSAWITRRLWMWPLGFSPIQPPRQRRWPRIPTILPNWRWSPTRAYWVGVIVVAAWFARFFDQNWPHLVQPWLPWLEFGLVWAAVFAYRTLQPAKPSVRHGHTLEVVVGPHRNLVTFVQVLFQYGLFSPIPKLGGEGRLSGLLNMPHLLTKGLRYFCGLGPLGVLGATAIMATTLKALGIPIPNDQWIIVWCGIFGASCVYWIIFAVSGRRKIIYWLTTSEGGGEVGMKVPRLRLWGLVADGNTAQRKIMLTASIQELFGGIVNIDLGGELTISGERINWMYGVNREEFSI